ncbi:MAG: toprim domain-containing protein [Anaerolineae bacterium]|nr:toprim domain-containing protein [Anaerolineae bacterium]
MTEAHLRLLRDPAAARAGAYLTEQRGLRPEAWAYGRLGFVPGRGYARGHGLRVPAGILIPWFCAGVLWMVNVRRPTTVPGQRYRRIAVGDGQPHQGGLYQAWTVARGRPVLVTEGEFDALLAYQLIGDIAGVVTPGAASNGVPARWLPLLAGAPAILSAHDADAAGQQGAARLGALSARVRRLALPAGQDLTDFVVSGGDLRALVAGALCR